MQLQKLLSLALLPALAGCATVGMMQGLAPDAGGLARYATTADTLVAVAEEVVKQQDMHIADTSGADGTRVVIAARWPGLFSNGEFARVRIAPDSGGLMAVRIVTQSGYLLDWSHRDGAPRLFQEMDSHLGMAALGPWPGMRVRATPHGGSAVIGTVARVIADTLILDGDPDHVPVLKIPALDGLAISRGSYRHTREGAVIGALLGGLLGVALGHSQESGSFQGLNAAAGILVGVAAGGVVGGVAGANVRTEVWSPVPMH